MKCIAVDNEKLILEGFIEELKKVTSDAEIYSFTLSRKAIEFVEVNHDIDIAFLDIEMPGLSGLALAKAIKDRIPKINIIFMTGYSRYVMNIQSHGYLMKPVCYNDIERELKYIEEPGMMENDRLCVHTFGKFEVYANGLEVKFENEKCMELFAYIINKNGEAVTFKEADELLYNKKQGFIFLGSQIKGIYNGLIKSLAAVGAENVLIKNKNKISVDFDKLDCDYIRALRGDMKAFNSYRGEYMLQYSWAKFIIGD